MEQNIAIVKKWLGTGSINFFGLPFVGKDTQVERIAQMLGAHTISGGAVLRSYKDQDALQNILATGELIPSEMYKNIVVPYLSRDEFSDKPLLLSSVGRMDGEQETILRAAEESRHPIVAAVLLTMPYELVWRRFEESQKSDDRGDRRDDNRSVLQTRIDEFSKKTLPVLDFYRQKRLLIEVDGTKSRDEVTFDIMSALARKASN